MDNGSHRFEWIHTKSTGENFWAEIVLTRIFINDENLIHVVWRDITEKKQLEEQILKRNIDLQESNDELEQTILNLKDTQKRLIESEKMAGLSNVIAGVAHEINTPIGIGVTGITHFLEITQNIYKAYEEDTLSQEEFEKYLNTSKELAITVDLNLRRTADLIRSFKQISVDQMSEEKRAFEIKEYINEILLSMSNITKKTNLTIDVQCQENLKIDSYPGAFSQVITNLIINSIKHAFKEKEKGSISIEVFKEKNILNLIYKDDGKGISKENLPKIFDPFFTTNRIQGGTGLGLNIIYNIITSRLNGSIICNSEENVGVEFIIRFDTQ